MKNNRKSIVCFLFFMILSLASCNGQTTATIQTQENTPTHALKIETTATPTIPPFVMTRIAGATRYAPTAIVLAQVASNDCNGYPDKMWKPYDQIFSPSGIWRIAYCQYPDTGANYAKVINTKTGNFWEVPYLNREGQNLPEGMTGGQMYFELWSNDEKFVYFERYFCCLDGPSMIFSENYGLFQLDLDNGKIVKIESGRLASDGYRIVYFDDENRQAIIEDLKSGQTTSFKIDEQLDMAGVFLWSPNESKIVFSAADENWFETGSGFAVYLIDVQGNAIRQLLFEPPHNYIALDWLSDSEILFGEARQGGEFILDIITNKITPTDSFGLTPTASP